MHFLNIARSSQVTKKMNAMFPVTKKISRQTKEMNSRTLVKIALLKAMEKSPSRFKEFQFIRSLSRFFPSRMMTPKTHRLQKLIFSDRYPFTFDVPLIQCQTCHLYFSKNHHQCFLKECRCITFCVPSLVQCDVCFPKSWNCCRRHKRYPSAVIEFLSYSLKH